MSSLTYTAKRNFVLEGLDVSGTDISIVATDDTFNSTSTDLSGMVSGDWILVSGSAVDDGWHQLSANSTTTKITTSSALTIESSGSLISIVGYKHGLDESYDLDFDAQNLDQSYDAKTKTSESLSGIVETLFLSEIKYWDIVTMPMSENTLLYWVEFIGSVRAGEPFSFDPYGSIASPSGVVSSILQGNPTISRVESSLLYTISFKVREL